MATRLAASFEQEEDAAKKAKERRLEMEEHLRKTQELQRKTEELSQQTEQLSQTIVEQVRFPFRSPNVYTWPRDEPLFCRKPRATSSTSS